MAMPTVAPVATVYAPEPEVNCNSAAAMLSVSVAVPEPALKTATPCCQFVTAESVAFVQFVTTLSHVPVPPSTPAVGTMSAPFQYWSGVAVPPTMRLIWLATEVCSVKFDTVKPEGTVPKFSELP